MVQHSQVYDKNTLSRKGAMAILTSFTLRALRLCAKN
jgi:hypothetical protein